MAGGTRNYQEKTVAVGTTQLHYLEGGQGSPLVIFHGELGFPGWVRFHDELAKNHRLIIPLHPGFGVTERTDWVTSIRDLAGFYARFLKEQKLAPVDVIGFSLGGWLAAEMAANNQQQFKHLSLVAPVGIRPPEGEILDLFAMPAKAYVEKSVHDKAHTAEFSQLYGGSVSPQQFEAWDDCQAETARLAWQPYMFNYSLPHLLEGVSNLPTLIVWGEDDKVVPISAAKAYQASLQGAKLVQLSNCGHYPEIEQPDAFLQGLSRFLAA